MRGPRGYRKTCRSSSGSLCRSPCCAGGRRTCRPRRCCWCSPYAATWQSASCCSAVLTPVKGWVAQLLVDHAVHAAVVRRAAAAGAAPRAHPADDDRGIRLSGGAGAAVGGCRLAVAALYQRRHLAGAGHLRRTAAAGVADRGQQSHRQGGARVVRHRQRRTRDPADGRLHAAAADAVRSDSAPESPPPCTCTSSASAALSWVASRRLRAPPVSRSPVPTATSTRR